MGTNPQDPHTSREVLSRDLKVGVSPTISARVITGPRICYETENSEYYVRLILSIFKRFRKVANTT